MRNNVWNEAEGRETLMFLSSSRLIYGVYFVLKFPGKNMG